MVVTTVLVVLGASSTHALVMCAKPRRDGTYNSTIMLRETCLRGETQLDPVALGLQGPKGDKGDPGEPGLPGPPAWERPCPSDSVRSGDICIDAYEASVWRIPPVATALVQGVQDGTVTIQDLTAGGATQLGEASDNYAPCADSGQNCANDIYAVSLPAVLPSANVTWLQAQQACKNARKRLPTSAEWQAAVAGTPDPGPDNGTTDCNALGLSAVTTGSRSSCTSADGAFDMVGNLYEWVADWVPRSTACGIWSAGVSPTGDYQCLAGAATSGDPGALLRGGGFLFGSGPDAGPLTVLGLIDASGSEIDIGFRCAR